MSEEKNQEKSRIVVFEDPLIGIRDVYAEHMEVDVDIQSLFSTELGKKYARQVKEQKQFTFVGILLPLLQNLVAKILPNLLEVFSDANFRETMRDSIDKAEDLADDEKQLFLVFPEFIEIALKSKSEESQDNSMLYGERSVERFLGAMVLAIHTYAEAYLDSMLNAIIENDNLRPKMLKYCDKKGRRPRPTLLELDEIAGSKNEVLLEFVKRSLPWNLPERMRSVAKALGQLGELEGYLSRTGEGKILDEFKYFCDRRNRIAHEEPAPDLEEYNLKLNSLDWEGLKERLFDELTKAWLDAPESLYTIIEIGCEWGRGSSADEYIALLERLYKMALLLPAVFDYYIFREEDPSRVRIEFKV